MKTGFIIIVISSPSKKEANQIVDFLLNERLIACANIIGGVESRFWWKGNIDKAKECIILIKARAKNFKKIEKKVKGMHSYEVPEIVAVPIIKSSAGYLKWLRDVS